MKSIMILLATALLMFASAASATESPDGTKILQPPPAQPTVTDSTGATWQLDTSFNILRNGSGSTVKNWQSHELDYSGHTVFVQGLDGNLYKWSDASSNWVGCGSGAPPGTCGSLPPANPNMVACSNEFDTTSWAKLNGVTAATGSGPVNITIPAGGSNSLNQDVSALLTKVSASTTYTLSWTANTVSGAAKLRAFQWNPNDGNSFSSDIAINGGRQSWTFTTGATLSDFNTGITSDAAGDATTFALSQVKLEVGSTATAYGSDTTCPCP